MKKLSLLLICLFLLNVAGFTQAPPQAFNYSAVARNASNNPIANTTIGIQISILKNSPTTGTVMYKENHFINTDQFGLFNLTVGSGAVQSGSMTSIDWSADNYYLKVGMDATGGSNFVTMGTTQLLSVPYALYAKTAGNSNDRDTSPTNELQTLSVRNDTIFLSNGGFAKLPAGNGTISLASPTITTATVTEISSNSAHFSGNISNAINKQIIERGFVCSTSTNPTAELDPNNNNAINAKIILGNGIGAFDTLTNPNALFDGGSHDIYSLLGSNVILSSNTTYYVRAYAITENNITLYGNEVTFRTLSVGQTGPAGGLVFYDKGNNTGGWRYLEAAPSNQSTASLIADSASSIPQYTQLEIGTGESNTSLMIASGFRNGAVNICNDLVLGGQNDWFLPSISELNLMYRNLKLNGLGNFASNFYWSSSWIIPITGGLKLYILDFNNGNTDLYGNSYQYVRAIRAY